MKFRHIALSLLLALPVQLGAGTIYNNLGTGNSYDASAYFTPEYASMSAVRFTATGGGQLDTVLLPVALLRSGQQLSIGLYTDAAGLPGAALESWTAPAPVASNPPLTVLTSSLHPSLQVGEQYWLAISAPFRLSLIWHRNNQGEAGGLWYGFSLGGLTNIQPQDALAAIQVNAVDEAVPEPATAMLLSLGLASIAAAYLRKKNELAHSPRPSCSE